MVPQWARRDTPLNAAQRYSGSNCPWQAIVPGSAAQREKSRSRYVSTRSCLRAEMIHTEALGRKHWTKRVATVQGHCHIWLRSYWHDRQCNIWTQLSWTEHAHVPRLSNGQLGIGLGCRGSMLPLHLHQPALGDHQSTQLCCISLKSRTMNPATFDACAAVSTSFLCAVGRAMRDQNFL